jgi:hypothetical protein
MSDYDSDQIEAIQTVVNHVSAYQDGAEQTFILEELRRGFDEVAIEVDPDDVTKLAEAIHEDNGDVSAAEVLG